MTWLTAQRCGCGVATVVALTWPSRGGSRGQTCGRQHRCGSAQSWAATYRSRPSTSRSGMRSCFLPTAPPRVRGAAPIPATRSQIYVRRLAELQATPLPGTDYAAVPFFSPDGKWIGFFAGGKLKKVAVGGGAPMTLADAPDQRGAWWSEDDTIVFSPTRTAGTRLLRVSATGGRAEAVAPLADAEVIQLWPQVLPGGRALLYTSGSIVGAYDDCRTGGPDVAGRPAQGRPARWLPRPVSAERAWLAEGRRARNGHLVYVHGGNAVRGAVRSRPARGDRPAGAGDRGPDVEFDHRRRPVFREQ